MKGGHDLGGKPGMGKINPEAENQEPVFHEDWERKVFGLTMATGMLGRWNIDESRHARERQEPAEYLKHSYYENWLEGTEKLLLEKKLIDSSELQDALPGSNYTVDPKLRVPDAAAAEKILASGSSSIINTEEISKFEIGDKVQVKNNYSAGHTRVPGYVQGSMGVIVKHLGCQIFPDSNAHGVHEGKHLYSVSFDGCDLWGPNSENLEVLVDLWEPYLSFADKIGE